MAHYIVRVELIGSPDSDVYSHLHALMAAYDFSMMTPGLKGEYVELPLATYHGETNTSVTALSAFFRDTIQTTLWTKAKVLVIEYTGASLADPT
jgi:hypothetical protein